MHKQFGKGQAEQAVVNIAAVGMAHLLCTIFSHDFSPTTAQQQQSVFQKDNSHHKYQFEFKK